ncbi:MAG: hypothetical protein O7G30_17845 [Proteobacteria bacterium]|nr:hypothetical protein [Pseudomonadota bacterium]
MATDASSADERLQFTAEELLADGDYREPLIANGVRCHGGFGEDGQYRSPRTVVRRPAIRAWQAQLARGGAPLIDIPRELMPPQYPNVEQSVLLLREGVRDPIVRGLTIISIVEGFGAIIRDVKVPKLGELVVEPLEGTALAHLRRGLFEAHARDEAGHRDQGGHKQMWEAARDLALENPKIPRDVLMRLMGRRGRRKPAKRPFPEIDEDLERMLSTMAQVLVVEVFAEGAFEWGKALLGNAEVSAEPERASEMVRFIQSDESPHVEYLRTALSEIRARTLRTVHGGTIPGRTVVDGLLHRILSQMTRNRPAEQREDARKSLSEAIEAASNQKAAKATKAVVEEFESLETSWTPPAKTGFEPTPAVEGAQ